MTRKPSSTRKKKEEQQLKRKIKRGDVLPPESRKSNPKDTSSSVSQKLQSSFAKLPRNFLENTKELASTLPLPRPVPPEAAILPESYVDNPLAEPLTCPRRPRWHYDMLKKEVDANEQVIFTKWLNQTDNALKKWSSPTDGSNGENEDGPFHVSPSFDRNLEVWRQLWRVIEISQIILVLADSRCPLLHFPPSLANFLSNHKVILVLSKVDSSGPIRASAWTEYFRIIFPSLRVVQVQSYTSKETHQGRSQYKPQIPQSFREQLIEAIRELHTELLEPPEKVKANPRWLSDWRPPVKRKVDWNRAVNFQIQRNASAIFQDSTDPEEEGKEPPFLTIGLVGQPNVGKSSLLNALFGESKVRASKTPGKTKHFQTLFLTPDIRLVDCPGLVMPNYVPMEMQVLSGILPISRVSAIPACIHFASQLLPLEDIFQLTHPKPNEAPIVDNRTWRQGTKRAERTPTFWTAMDILIAFANKKGWVTAKAGRPDFSRAGNAILRTLAEGRVRWGFWPPGTPVENVESEMSDTLSHGIWIQRDDLDVDKGYESSDRDEEDDGEEGIAVDEAEFENDPWLKKIDNEEEERYMNVPVATIRFAALQIEDSDGKESETNYSSDEN
ncbi:hypothetical protein GYMLUDRAFT_78920 [Collybiopsis luxurians FD-317 M1]|nr:hypothetical protein GYMLUDRAFT_78920 [Collybiopsis luxurians FD-317 M1]